MSAKDALYSDNFKQYILDFMTITQTEFSLVSKKYLDCVQKLLSSAILNVLAQDPTNTDAKACLTDFLQENSGIPTNFSRNWIALSSTTANINRNILGHTSSINVKIQQKNIEPLTTLTNFTAKAKKEMLQEDLKNNVEIHTVNQKRAPTEIKLELGKQVMDKVINSILALYETIAEGNRQNGMEPDKYIQSILKPKN